MDHEMLSDVLERKGSLFLRSNHMQYDRPTLVSGWHQSREAEPKDYDLTTSPLGEKDLHHSTYKRFGNVEKEDWNTSTKEQLSHLNLKEDYEVKDLPKSMVNENNINTINFRRDTGCPERGFGAVLPHHNSEHNKMHLETTYRLDYMAHCDYTVSEGVCSQDHIPNWKAASGAAVTGRAVKFGTQQEPRLWRLQADTLHQGIPNFPDYSAAYKKCHSQFTDTADYRRPGRNTWQDESGIYANNGLKRMVFKSSCPITPHS